MVSKRHIIQVSSYYPPHLGGQENAVHDLAEQLAKSGDSVDVLTSTAGGGTKGATNEHGVRVRRMSGFVFGHAPIMPWFPIALFRAASQKSLVHIHIGQAFTPEMVWLVSKIRRFKYIAQLHIDFEPSGPAGILLPLYKRFVLRRVIQSASAVIVLNEKTLRVIREVYKYSGSAQVMNNGLDEAYFNIERPPFALNPPKMLRLLFVGRLSKQKNIGELLKALPLTKRQVHLDIIGEGPENDSIQDAITDLKLKNVTRHGRLARRDILKFYASSDALIMPSLYEAQPLVLLEAMASRIPIIGTNVTGVKEHIRDSGIIVEPTAKGLAEGIDQYYVKYSSLPKMVKRGYDISAERSWPRTLREYEKLYEKILER